jgi:pantoate ligase / CMP/dCMP kinase
LELLRTRAQLANWRRGLPPRPLHFVPTMGAVHQGHQQLIRRAAEPRSSGDPTVIVSVFVNPLQFGRGEDFDSYPRDLDRDGDLAAEAGAQALFAPSLGEMFPQGEAEITRILPPASLGDRLCGLSRPGHFEGVATIVCRLLALVQPQRLVMGEKDWQQLVILRRVVADLGLNVILEGCATVRGPDSLACSSRNRYLSQSEAVAAAALPQALAQAALDSRSDPGAAGLIFAVRARLEAAGLRPDYVELVRAHNLTPLQRVEGLALLAVAAYCGPSRLIDHVFLMTRAPIVAIDGPAGAGKSTVTQALAKRLGLLYLDTGAMYRALTWWIQRQGMDPADASGLPALLASVQITFSEGFGAGGQRVLINEIDVSEVIRSPEVTAAVSTVAAHACVRETLTRQQQAMGQRGGLVAEGRDTGTAVFPDADCKVFLTATVSERARRRADDLRVRGFSVPPLAELEQQIAERDRMDASRAVAPLIQADDAVELVTDGLAVEAVIQALVDLFRSRVPEEAWPEPVT